MYFEYWSPLAAGGLTPQVNGQVCGQGVESWFPLAPPNNQYVFVKADATSSGCGGSGAIVTLRAGDAVLEQLLWQPGQVSRQNFRRAGDVDCDSDSDSADAALVLHRGAGLLERLACEDAADVSQDGRADSRDVAVILQLEAGLIVHFP
jgi:hypothetical protein